MDNLKDFKIIKASKEMLDDIKNIVKKSFSQYCQAINIETTDALIENDQDILNDIQNKFVFVAYYNSIPVGTIRLTINNDMAFISRFAIHPEFQGLGIGSMVLEYVSSYLKKKKIKSVELFSATENIVLKEFYIKNGFNIISFDLSKGYIRGLFQKKL